MFEIIPIIQSHERTCGQTCIAMLTGKTEDEIIKLIGHAKGTKTKEIVKILNLLNIGNTQKLLLITKKTRLPDIGILKTVYDNVSKSKNWHWILKYRNKYYDPSGVDIVSELKIISFIGISNA